MYVNRILELSMVLDTEKFAKAFKRACEKSDRWDEDGKTFIDNSLSSKGLTVCFRDSQYKKKITVTVNSALLTDSGSSGKLLRKLRKHISEYFGNRYTLDDFVLSGTALFTDIDVGSSEKAEAYIKVLRRIGKVKGFSPAEYEGIDGYCLDGNSNGISFMIYDLEPLKHKGILRAEVRLNKAKTIRDYTDTHDTEEQIAALFDKSEKLFMAVLVRIIPYGDFYKKDKAEEIICRRVDDPRLRRRMLRLVALLPEKKSLLLAQKALQYREIDYIMESFTKINLSPITIGKRQETKRLDNLYSYLM